MDKEDLKQKKREYNRLYKKRNRNKIRESDRKYRKSHRDKIKVYSRKWIFKKDFGGNREKVLERDNFSCVKCGMTKEEHTNLFGCFLSIDHIDGNRENNIINNLQTLCLKCHGKKDGAEHWNIVLRKIIKIIDNQEKRTGKINKNKLIEEIQNSFG